MIRIALDCFKNRRGIVERLLARFYPPVTALVPLRRRRENFTAVICGAMLALKLKRNFILSDRNFN